jgi:hypothetical protein
MPSSALATPFHAARPAVSELAISPAGYKFSGLDACWKPHAGE